MKKYYLHIDENQGNHAGSKAVNDCEVILKKRGYELNRVFSSNKKNKYLKKCEKVLQLRELFNIPKKSILVIRHPIYIKPLYINILKKLKERNKIILIFLIHDLESVRDIIEHHENYVQIDETMYEIADYIICHNKIMKEYLIDQGVDSSRLISLEIFDYLFVLKERNRNQQKNSVIVAGNLDPRKCGYIYELARANPEIKINLYGGNFDSSIVSENIDYKGSFKPDEVPNVIEGGFGVVWDGTTSQTCTGNTGEYLKINNPHKTSLYLSSGFPVVVWSQSAISHFVRENNVGICVDSLNDLTEALNNVTETQYKEMLSNVNIVGKKLREGYYLNNALKKVELLNK